jgi:hypothetical protein
VKRSDRDESIVVVIHLYMEAMLGISLYSYPYFKLAKMLCLSYYCYVCLLFNKIVKEGRTGFPGSVDGGGKGKGWWTGWRDGPNHVCIYELMNK